MTSKIPFKSAGWLTALSSRVPVASLNVTLYVTAGDHTLMHYDGLEQTVEVEEAIVFPEYNFTTNANDVALLRLKQPLYFNRNVRPVCVAENDPPTDAYCVSIGWGITQGEYHGGMSTGNHCWDHYPGTFSSLWSHNNTLRPRQNCRHLADDIFWCIFLNENVQILLKISLKFVLKVWINKVRPLVQIMVWHR